MNTIIIEGIKFWYNVWKTDCYIGRIDRIEAKKKGESFYSAYEKFEEEIGAETYNLDVLEGREDWRVEMYGKVGYKVVSETRSGTVTMAK